MTEFERYRDFIRRARMANIRALTEKLPVKLFKSTMTVYGMPNKVFQNGRMVV
jgi:hypothetical protein